MQGSGSFMRALLDNEMQAAEERPGDRPGWGEPPEQAEKQEEELLVVPTDI